MALLLDGACTDKSTRLSRLAGLCGLSKVQCISFYLCLVTFVYTLGNKILLSSHSTQHASNTAIATENTIAHHCLAHHC